MSTEPQDRYIMVRKHGIPVKVFDRFLAVLAKRYQKETHGLGVQMVSKDTLKTRQENQKAPMSMPSHYLTLHPQVCRVEIDAVQIGTLEQIDGCWHFTPLGWFASVPGSWGSLGEARKALLLSGPIASFRQMKKPPPTQQQKRVSTYRPGVIIGQRTILEHWRGPKGYLVRTRCVCGREQALTARGLHRHATCGCQGKKPREEKPPGVLAQQRRIAVEMLTVQEKNHQRAQARQELERPVYGTEIVGLPASVRLQRCLQSLGVRIVLDVMRYTPLDILQLPNLGRASIQELRATLAAIGVKWPNLHMVEVLAADQHAKASSSLVPISSV